MNLSNSELYAMWRKRMKQIMPDLTHVKYRLTNMMLMAVGLYQAKNIYLSHIAAELPIVADKKSLTERMGRLMRNEAIVVEDWYRPVAEDLLQRASQGEQLCLIVDGTQVSSQHQLLMVGVAYYGRAMPVIWDWVDYPRGHSTAAKQVALFTRLKALIPANTDVMVLGDSEFGNTMMLETLDEWGWNYVLRQKGRHQVKPAGCGLWHRLDAIPIEPGDWQPVGDVALTATYAYPTRFVAQWKEGEKDPWLLATNLDCLGDAVTWYAKRAWIEEFFGDVKGHGFDLEHSRLGTADRLSRLTLIVCLVYLWLVALGECVLERGWGSFVDRSDRRDLSIFRLGWDLLKRALSLGEFGRCPSPMAHCALTFFIPSFSKVYGC